MGGTTSDSHAAALALIAQLERQAVAISRNYDNGTTIGGNYSAYRLLAERLDEFHVFGRLVENRLSDVEPEKREAQTQVVMDVRSRILLLEIDAMHSFLNRYAEGGKPWPLGSKPFLIRQQARVDEIATEHRELVALHKLQPPDEAMLTAVAAQFVTQLERIQQQESFGTRDFGAGLEDFAAPRRRPEPPPAAAPPESQAAVAAEDVVADASPAASQAEDMPLEEFPIPVTPVDKVTPPAAPPAAKASKPAAAPASGSFLKPKQKFKVKNTDGNVYVEVGGLTVVEDACKHAKITLNDLARDMGLNRAALVLMLNGSDAIEKKPLTQLRAFIMRNGGLI